MVGYGNPLLGLSDLAKAPNMKPPVVPVGETVRVSMLLPKKIEEPDGEAPPDVTTVCVVLWMIMVAPSKLYWVTRSANAGVVPRTIMSPTTSQISLVIIASPCTTTE